MNLFDIGDKVRVVKYGSWMCDNTKGEMRVYDIMPQLVGKEGVVSKVNLCQEKYSYALEKIEGKHAWYDEGQLEMVNRNPNNDDANNIQ